MARFHPVKCISAALLPRGSSYLRIAPILVLPFALSQASAFEVWGFHTGMTQQQVASVARQQGYDVVKPENTPTRWQNTSYSRKLQSGTYELGYLAGFCDGHLVWLSHDYKGNIATLFELLEELKGTYGAPSVSSSSQVVTDGRIRAISFEFHPRPGDIAEVAVTLNMQDDTDFGIQVIHKISYHCDTPTKP